jgi:hypothetical protein
MNRPKCFVAVFGDPQPGKNRVDSGEYHPDSRYAPFQTEPGHLMLLYCTGSYPRQPMKIPGIGVVLSTDRESVKIDGFHSRSQSQNRG